jgi:hypothetical protein
MGGNRAQRLSRNELIYLFRGGRPPLEAEWRDIDSYLLYFIADFFFIHYIYTYICTCMYESEGTWTVIYCTLLLISFSYTIDIHIFVHVCMRVKGHGQLFIVLYCWFLFHTLYRYTYIYYIYKNDCVVEERGRYFGYFIVANCSLTYCARYPPYPISTMIRFTIEQGVKVGYITEPTGISMESPWHFLAWRWNGAVCARSCPIQRVLGAFCLFVVPTFYAILAMEIV